MNVSRTETSGRQRGVGPLKIPLLADRTQKISRAYGVLNEAMGSTFRYTHLYQVLLLLFNLEF